MEKKVFYMLFPLHWLFDKWKLNTNNKLLTSKQWSISNAVECLQAMLRFIWLLNQISVGHWECQWNGN